MSIADALKARFEGEAAKTRAILEAVPEDKYDWKPHEKSMTAGQLASHLAETASWHESMLQDTFDFEAMMADYKPFAAADRKELLDAVDAGNAAFVAAIAGKDDDFMQGLWTGLKGTETVMAGPRHLIMASFLVDHQIHHRGQLTVYLRLLDIPVPPTFGPTADFPDSM